MFVLTDNTIKVKKKVKVEFAPSVTNGIILMSCALETIIHVV